MSFWSKYGTLNSREDEGYAENSTLWAAEYLYLKELAGESPEPELKVLVDFIQDDLRISDGLYDQLPYRDGNHEDLISNDQISSFMVLSHRYELGIHHNIWKEIKRQLFRYDNINPEKPSWKRFLHPRDIMFYGCLAGNPLWLLTLPLLFAMSLFSILKPQGETSGKLLWFVRINAIKNVRIRNKLLKLLDKLVPGGMGKAFRIYFSNERHPINQLSLNIYPNV